MTVVTDTHDIARLTQLVQQALDKRQPPGYRLQVQANGILQEDDWYRVIVQSDRDVRTYDFYDVLSEAEAELQDQEHLNVLLVPAVGD